MISVVVVAAATVTSASGYNTTDPTVFAPKCQSPLHRSFKHCLDGSTVGGVALTGNTHTIDPGSGETYEFTVDVPKRCPANLKNFKGSCTVSVDWGVLYGASLAKWGNAVDDTVEPRVTSGCRGNDLVCAFTASVATPVGPPLPDGTALRVTAVAQVVGLQCGKATTGYCYHWMDWPMRLHATASRLEIDWTMPARLTSTEAQSWKSGSYGLAPLSYADPETWDVTLFLANGGNPTCPSGVSFRWTVTGGGSTDTLPGDGCRVKAKVKRLGTYTVKAEELKGGAPDGTNVTNERVVVRDWLVVGLGDSNGSGQGNPPYIYEQCDRSESSHQYLVAKYLEDHDPRSSVTFLWASCSGARSDQIWRNTYVGQEENRGSTLPPQLDQIEGRLTASTRKVDAVLMSIGINDIFFGPIMGFCSTYGTRINTAQPGRTCESAKVVSEPDSQGYTADYTQSETKGAETLEQITNDRISELKTDYRLLEARLAKLEPAHVFLTQYPDETTNASGALCNGSGPPPRLEETVWSFLHKAGADLNRAVGAAASLGWTPITGIAADFTGHGYCSPDTYFRTIVASGLSQGNAFGSFHATAAGQAITFSHDRDAVCKALYGNTACDGEPPPSS
jgi:hypothetical protein